MRQLTLLFVGLLISALNACAAPTAGSMPADSQLSSGRYAMQVKSYFGVFESEPLYIPFAFIDLHPDQATYPEPQFNAVQLLSDQGPISATVRSPTTLSRSSNPVPYQHRTGTLHITDLASGTYSIQAIEYVDEYQRQQRLLIGDWRIEVVDGASPTDLEEWSASIGASSFGTIQATMRNRVADAATLTGLTFNLPTGPITTTVSEQIEDEPPVAAPSASTANPTDDHPIKTEDSIKLVDYITGSVILEPGQTRDINFLLEPNDLSEREPFIVLKPFMTYQMAADATIRYHPLPNQLYFRSFDTEEHMLSYLQHLLPDAYHAFQ